MQFNLFQFIQAAQNPITFVIWLFANGGWIPIVGLIFYGGAVFWLEWRRSLYDQGRRFITLAIDVPRNNEQTPKAVEQMITHLSGAHDGSAREDKWIDGRMDESFGLEIVSIGGYIQFIIHTNVIFRDLVEAAVYSQYPDVEISTIQDYTKPFKGMKFPNDEWDCWGTDLKPTNHEAYPIKTYPSFEHTLSGEFIDPLGPMLEAMSKLGPDEQIWFQILVTNTDVSWRKKSNQLVKKLIGAKGSGSSKTIWDFLIDLPMTVLSIFGDMFTPSSGSEKNPFEPPTLMQHISPGERSSIEAIEMKASKVGFFTKVRFMYIARKSSFNGTRIDEMFGAIKQFNTLDMNGLKPDKLTVTKVYGLFKPWRKNRRKTRMLRRYRLRGTPLGPGYFGKIMNSEELATLYHFPVISVKAPLIKKSDAKRAEPPLSLPIE